jgi:Dienelactone hydrolase and related enzymes
MCLAVPAGLLAASTGLSTAAIVTSLLVPQTSRVVRLPEVARREVSELRADLYLHPDGPSPGVVLVLGALREGRRYALLEATARSLASCGYAVLVPELGRLRQLILGQDALDDLVGAALALGEQRDVQRGPVGLFGFSLGGSLALLAAGDDRLRHRVACVACMGGYFRLVDMLTAATAGVVGANGETISLAAPSVYTVSASLIAHLPDKDRKLLERALNERPDAPLEAMSRIPGESVGAQAQVVLALLRNRDPGAVSSILQDLDGAASMMTKLSPETVIPRIGAPVWVLHDERDRYVPSQQSRLMREAVAGRANFKFFSIRLLEHTEPIALPLNPARLFHDYLPGLVRLARFVHGPLAALRKALA